MASPITGVSIVCSTVCSGTDQRKHQRSASLAFVRGIHRWPMNSPHRGPVTRKMFQFEDVIMILTWLIVSKDCRPGLWFSIKKWKLSICFPRFEPNLLHGTLAYIDGLAQDCSNSSALAMELLQSCAKSSIYSWHVMTRMHLPRYWPFGRGKRWIPSQMASNTLMFSLILAWRNCWRNNQVRGDSRCQNVIVMGWTRDTAGFLGEVCFELKVQGFGGVKRKPNW